MPRLAPIILLFLLATNLQAQETASSDERAFNFFYANDVISQTDQYYTNGVRFDLVMPIFAKSPFSLSWLRWQKAATSYHTLNFRYDVFTPDLHQDLYTDRPFAAVMMLGSKHQYILPKNNLMLTSELQFGVIGQATGAGKLQNGLHKIMPHADSVVGWDTQVRNDMALNYIFTIDKQILRSNHAEIILGASAFIGSPYTKLQPHLIMRFGLIEDYFNRLNSNMQNNWQAFVYGDFKAAYVAYNATLQGGPFNPHNPYVLTEIVPFMLDFHLGIGLTYKNYTFSAGHHFLTPEFYGADSHMWSEINFMVTF